jgi:hypothetical protein
MLRKRLIGYLSFLLVLVLVVGLLRLLGWLPQLLSPQGLRSYRSLQQAQELLHRSIPVPAYFPPGLSWPPSKVLAQGEPFFAALLEFSDQEGRPALRILHSCGSPVLRPEGPLKLRRIVHTVRFSLKGKELELQSGLCAQDSPCSHIRWSQQGCSTHITYRGSPPELLRMAESMID